MPMDTATPQDAVYSAIFVNTFGGDLTGPVAAVIVSGVGNTTEKANATAPRYIFARDIGAASDYPGVISI